MNLTVLLIGDGPFANHMAKRFTEKGFSIIMTTIKEQNVDTIRSNGYIPIYSGNLHKDGCKKIHEQCMSILKDYSLVLKYIVHTARKSFYEYSLKVEHDADTGHDIYCEIEELEPSDEVKDEMFKVNSLSPESIARYFADLDCQFIYITSCATAGFPRNLSHNAFEKKDGEKVGTHAIKYYAYTKRLGEESLYKFFEETDNLSLLTLAYISIMLGTNFYTDMGIPDPVFLEGFWTAERTAIYITDKILKGKKRIYPGWQSKSMGIAPRALNAKVLDNQKWLSD